MNEDQIAYWGGERAARWIERQVVLDRALAPFGEAALARLAPQAGEHALDIGCGCGATTLDLARLVVPGGTVVGLDLSGGMLARARERALELAHVSFVEADAACFVAARPFDLLFSRFGVMFFDDPARAFAHLRSQLRPGARLAWACWRAPKENAWSRVPLEAARSVVAELPSFTADGAPGPFAFADEDKLRNLLASAGLSEIEIARFDADVLMAPDDLAEAVSFAINAGPLARVLPDVPLAAQERIQSAVTEALRGSRTPRGYALNGSCWIVSARV
jgi:ubiquinone/menaquinone biosynthesis C-methylase UbiE